MSTWLDEHRGVVFGALSVVALAGAGLFYWRQPSPTPIEIIPAETAVPTAAPTAPAANTPTPAPVRIYISGAVAHADVYFLPAGSIIKDAVKAAGGLVTDADPERINMALELQDQQHIHVPHIGEENPPPPVEGRSAAPVSAPVRGSATGSSLINLNTATPEDLDSLPGIGPAIAQRIIEYRESMGGFSSTEQIQQVSGIGPSTFAKISDFITVE